MRWTTEQTLDEASPAARFRHNSWKHIRRRVFAAMQTCHVSLNRRNAFATCGNAAVVMESDTTPGVYKLSANHCHDRLCTPCANARSAEIARALHSRLTGAKLSFITLTLCGKGEPLTAMLTRLYEGFRALRTHPRWKAAVRGGAAFLEVKYSDKAHRWHPHFHLICDADYIDHGLLSTIWRTITGDSYIVDVRRVNDPAIANRYVTKYASKPLNTSFSNDPSLLQEALTSLHGRRLCFSFGSWYKTPLHQIDEPPIDNSTWTAICSLSDLIREVDRGNDRARQILEAAGLTSRYRRLLLSDTS